MKQLVRKEALVALIPFLIVFVGISWLWLASEHTETFLAPNDKLWGTLMFTGIAVGALCGYMQFWVESVAKTEPYLVHRDGGHRAAFRAKVIVGLCISSAMLIGPPLVFLAKQLATSPNAGIIPSARILELGWLVPDAWLGYACGVLASQLRRWKLPETIILLLAGAGALFLIALVLPPLVAVPWRGAMHALGAGIASVVMLKLAAHMFQTQLDRELPLMRWRESTAVLCLIALCATGISAGASFFTQQVRLDIERSLPKIVRVESSGAVRAVRVVRPSDDIHDPAIKNDVAAFGIAVNEDGVPLVPREIVHLDMYLDMYTVYGNPPRARETNDVFDPEWIKSPRFREQQSLHYDPSLGDWAPIHVSEGSEEGIPLRDGRSFLVQAWLDGAHGTIEMFWLVPEDRTAQMRLVAVSAIGGSPTPVASYAGSLPLARTLEKSGGTRRFSPQTFAVKTVGTKVLVMDGEDNTLWLLDLSDPSSPIRPVVLPDGDRFLSLVYGLTRADLAVGSWVGAKWLIAGEKSSYLWDGTQFQTPAQWNPDGKLIALSAHEAEAQVELRAQVVDDEPFFPSVEVRDLKSGDLRLAYRFRAQSAHQKALLAELDLLALCMPPFASVQILALRYLEHASPQSEGLVFARGHFGLMLFVDIVLSALLTSFTWRRLTTHGASLPVRVAYAIGALVLGLPAALLLFMTVPRLQQARATVRGPISEPVLLTSDSNLGLVRS